jgi:hypothetical protein
MTRMAGPADEAAIREQAYYFWEQDGRPDGREMEHWSRAAVAVAERAQMDRLTEAPPKPSAASRLVAAASRLKAAPRKAVKVAAKLKRKKK